MQIKAILLDRDGIINKKRDDYVKSWNEFEFLDDSIEALKLFTTMNFKIIIVTNQSVINRNIISVETLNNIHLKMHEELKKHGISIDEIFFCPHRPDENCICRKPKSGLLKKTLEKFNLSPDNCIMIGDSESDITAGESLGIQSILVKENNFLNVARDICNSSKN